MQDLGSLEVALEEGLDLKTALAGLEYIEKAEEHIDFDWKLGRMG